MECRTCKWLQKSKFLPSLISGLLCWAESQSNLIVIKLDYIYTLDSMDKKEACFLLSCVPL